MAGLAELKIERRAAAGKMALLLRKGSLAVTDQALFSGANFLVNVLLARRLAPQEYGAYSLAYAWFLLLAALHQALLIEPMMIFGAGKYLDRFPRYLVLLIGFHAMLLAPAGLLLWLISAVFGRVYFNAARGAFEGMALASALILLFWMLRRVFYVLMKPGWGVASSLLYLAALAGSVGVLWVTDALTPRTAFLAMGLAGLLVSAMVWWRVASRQPERGASITFRAVVADHWRYGRWAMASALASWFPSNIYYLLLSVWLGLEGAAALRALTNFIQPVTQAVTALNMLMIPTLVRDRREGGTRKMNQTMGLFLMVLGGGCLMYLGALWILRGQVFQIFYGGRYSQYMGWPLVLAGALPVGTCLYSVLGNGLRALERPDRMFWAFVGSTLAAVVFGIPLTARYGVSGALLGNHCSAVVFVAALWWLYRSLSRRPATQTGAAQGAR
jgi:O-antigen/teichoic acid export membrane protein